MTRNASIAPLSQDHFFLGVHQSNRDPISLWRMIVKNGIFFALIGSIYYAFDQGYVVSDRLDGETIALVEQARYSDKVAETRVLDILANPAPEKIWEERFDDATLFDTEETLWKRYGALSEEVFVKDGALIMEHKRVSWTGATRTLTGLQSSTSYALEANVIAGVKDWAFDIFINGVSIAGQAIPTGHNGKVFLEFKTDDDFNSDSESVMRLVSSTAEDTGDTLSISSVSLRAMPQNEIYDLLVGTSLSQIKRDNGQLVLDFHRNRWDGIAVNLSDYQPGGIYRLTLNLTQLNQQASAVIFNNTQSSDLGGMVVPKGEYLGKNALILPFAAPPFPEHDLVLRLTPMQAKVTGGKMRIAGITLERIDL